VELSAREEVLRMSQRLAALMKDRLGEERAYLSGFDAMRPQVRPSPF
jgi:hypothetical protein